MIKKFILDLQLFADGTGDAGTSSAGATATATNGTESGVNTEAAVPNAGAETADRASQYAKFKNDFKDELDSEIKNVVQNRLKKSKQFEGKANKVFARLADRYGKDAKDTDGILNAFLNDDAQIAEKAAEMGVSASTYREMAQLREDNAAFRAAEDERRRQTEEQEIYQQWEMQIAEAKKTYPTLDFRTEISNQDFARLIKASVPVKTAYEIIHMDELREAAVQSAVQQAQGKLANSVAANISRPSENGTNGNATALHGIDINSLSASQMAAFKEAAARGEVITFR